MHTPVTITLRVHPHGQGMPSEGTHPQVAHNLTMCHVEMGVVAYNRSFPSRAGGGRQVAHSVPRLGDSRIFQVAPETRAFVTFLIF